LSLVTHTIVVATDHTTVVYIDHGKLTAPQFEEKEIPWQRTALLYLSPSPWKKTTDPKPTNFLRFSLTSVQRLSLMPSQQ